MSDNYRLNADHTVSKAPGLEGYSQDRNVAKSTVNGCDVSTVFLVLDHSWTVGSKPILFETMVFGRDDSQPLWRYHTWQEAVEGHGVICEALKAGKSFDDLYELEIGA